MILDVVDNYKHYFDALLIKAQYENFCNSYHCLFYIENRQIPSPFWLWDILRTWIVDCRLGVKESIFYFCLRVDIDMPFVIPKCILGNVRLWSATNVEWSAYRHSVADAFIIHYLVWYFVQNLFCNDLGGGGAPYNPITSMTGYRDEFTLKSGRSCLPSPEIKSYKKLNGKWKNIKK